MSLVLVGLSHKTAPIKIREQIAFSENQLNSALTRLNQEFKLRESMIVSTCNRVENNCSGKKTAKLKLQTQLKIFFTVTIP